MPAPQSGLPSVRTPENEKLWNEFIGKLGTFGETLQSYQLKLCLESRQGLSYWRLGRTEEKSERASGREGRPADSGRFLHVCADQSAFGKPIFERARFQD